MVNVYERTNVVKMLSVFAHQLILSFLIIEIGVNVHTYHIHNHRFTVNAFSTINHLTDVRYKTYFFTQTVGRVTPDGHDFSIFVVPTGIY